MGTKMFSQSIQLARTTPNSEDISRALFYKEREKSLHRLEKAIWLYIILLILEGSVRKWVPGMAGPFLLVRDPLALFIWISGLRLKVGNKTAWLLFHVYAALITMLGLLQIIAVPLPPEIFLYGWRSYVLHFPVIIVATGLLSMEDLRKIAKWVMIASIPMTILMILQYLAPEDAFINHGAGEGSRQISGALDHIRPAGTFSFITGPSYFYPVVASFICCGFTEEGLFPRWLLIASGIATLIAIPVSVSRTLALMVGLTVGCAFASLLLRGGSLLKANQVNKLALRGIIALLIIAGVSQIGIVQDAMVTFAARWTSAGDTADLGNRVGDQLEGTLDPVIKTTALGVGIGSGSQAAAILSGPNANIFRFGEDSNSREIYELGSLIGTAFVLSRFAASIFAIFLASIALQRGSSWAWCLLPAIVTLLTGAGLDQTTTQGFFVVTIAFFVIALKSQDDQSVALV